MNRQSAIALARLGHSPAIAWFLYQSLPVRDLKLQVAQQGNGLKILLRGQSVPPQALCMGWLSRELSRLSLPEIQAVRVYAQTSDRPAVAWMSGFWLTNSTAPSPRPPHLVNSVEIDSSSVLTSSTRGGALAVLPQPETALTALPEKFPAILPGDLKVPLHPFFKALGIALVVSGVITAGVVGWQYWTTPQVAEPILSTAIPHDLIASLPLFPIAVGQDPNLPAIRALLNQQLAQLRLEQARQRSRVSGYLPATVRGKTVYQATLPRSQKLVALTFDDGPWPTTTQQTLQILKRYHVKATFFWVGQVLQAYPDIAKRVVAEGHAVGNHTWHHWYRFMNPETAAHEIDRTAHLIQKITGQKTKLFRPPGGFLDNGLATSAHRRQDAVVMWSIDVGDTRGHASPPTLAHNVLSQIHPGAVVLLHDGGGNRSTTVQALPTILQGLKQRGYQFVTLPELFEQEYQHTLPPPFWLSVRSPEELPLLRDRLQQSLADQSLRMGQLLLKSPTQHQTQIKQSLAQAERYWQALQTVEWRLDWEEQAKRQWYLGVKNAMQAAILSNVRPASLTTWQQSQAKWQAAIAHLEQVPAQSFWGTRARQKAQEYRQHFQQITLRQEIAQSEFLQDIAQRSNLGLDSHITVCHNSGICRQLNGFSRPSSAASLIKVPVAIAVLQKVQQEKINLNTPLYVSSGNYTEDASEIQAGLHYPLRTLLNQMITHSSNIATNQLIDYVGWDAINQSLQQHGYQATQVHFKLMGETTMPMAAGSDANSLTTHELTLMMRRIYNNQEPGAKFLQQALKNQQDRALGYAALKNTSAQWLGEKTGQNDHILGTTLALQIKGEKYFMTVIDESGYSELNIRSCIQQITDYLIQHPFNQG